MKRIERIQRAVDLLKELNRMKIRGLDHFNLNLMIFDVKNQIPVNDNQEFTIPYIEGVIK